VAIQEVLACNNNKLASIPDDIGNLLVLSTLRVDNNELTSLPSSIAALVSRDANAYVHDVAFVS